MFITPYNYLSLSSKVVQEEVSPEVLVEPSESFTVRELIYRLAMGMPVSSGMYSGDYPDQDQDFDDSLPTEDPDFDLADYAAMKQELADKYETVVRPTKVSEKADQVEKEAEPATPEPNLSPEM